MPRLHACPACGRHVRVRTPTCPHCQSTLSSAVLSPKATALGLALASSVGCSSGLGGAEPEYGVAIVETGQSDDTGHTGNAGEESGEGEGGEGAGGEGAGEEGAGEEGEGAGEGGAGGESGGEGTSGESDYGIAALPLHGDAPSESD